MSFSDSALFSSFAPDFLVSLILHLRPHHRCSHVSLLLPVFDPELPFSGTARESRSCLLSTPPPPFGGDPQREAVCVREQERAGVCSSPWGSRSYVSTNYPTPTYRFQYSKLWSKNLDKTTTKCSLENPFSEKLILQV